jgi:hypothetical protein
VLHRDGRTDGGGGGALRFVARSGSIYRPATRPVMRVLFILAASVDAPRADGTEGGAR